MFRTNGADTTISNRLYFQTLSGLFLWISRGLRYIVYRAEDTLRHSRKESVDL